MDALDKERWIALSPLLDELLDLEEADRPKRLAELREQDPVIAEALEKLLARDAELNAKKFMDRPAAEALGAAFQAGPTLDTGGSPDLTGQTIGPYELERELGQGGMGAVWLARRADGRFQGQVAIKFLKAGLFGGGDNGRFAREGQILARLSHPHIARMQDAGVHNGHQPYLVLEFVDGLPIDRYCHVHGLDIEARIRLFLDVLAAVAHAHQRLILHRDLKPSNILVTAEGEVKLLDFGIAKLMDDATQPAVATLLTQQAGSAFTPQYAAPEQIQQGDVTTATDVYALGVLLYQLLGGRHPTADDTQTHLDRLKAVVDLVPKRLSEVASGQLDPVIARQAKLLQGDLDTILAKALKKAPAERYANAEQFSADLQHWLAHEPISARPDTSLYVLGRFVRRHRLAVAAGSVAVGALIGLTTFSAWQAHRATEAEHQAQQRRQQADDLLSFMLGEFADKLRPIGRLELLDSVGSKALTYLAQDAGLTGQERLQRAKALTVLGEVRVSKRDLDGAFAPLDAAERLLAGAPPDKELAEDWYKAKGVAAFWDGHANFSKRDFERASEAWRRYQASSQAWLTSFPASKDALVELSYAENSLGSARLEAADLKGAEERFRASLELKRRVLALAGKDADPGLRMDLADSMSWLGTTLFWEGHLHSASILFDEGVDLISDVRRAAANNGLWAYRQAVMQRWASGTSAAMGKRGAALSHIDAAVALMQDLQAQDPSNLNWQNNLLYAQAVQLDYRGPLLSPPERLSRWRGLATRWEEIERKSAPDTQGRRVEHQVKVKKGLALELAAQGHGFEAMTVLESTANQLRQTLDQRPSDHKLLVFFLDIASTQLKLSSQIDDKRGTPTRQQRCQEIVDRIEKIKGLIGVHQQITSWWVGAQSCLGKGNSEEVLEAKRWLSTLDSVNSTP